MSLHELFNYIIDYQVSFPAAPAMPQLTDAQWNDAIVYGAVLIFGAVCGLSLLIFIGGELSGAGPARRKKERAYQAARAAKEERYRIAQQEWELKHPPMGHR
jgi:hypothetical protein